MLVIPPGLSQEEAALQQKFNKLKKKKRALLALKKRSSTASLRGAKRSLPGRRVVDAATATEQAKQLVKSGAIRAIKAEAKNSGFKRPRTLKRKLKDPEKGPVPTFQTFQRSPSAQRGLQESSRGRRRTPGQESSASSRARPRDPGPEGQGAEGPGAGGGPPRSFDWGYEEPGAICSKISPSRRPDRSRERHRDHSRERNRDRNCERNMEPIRHWNQDPCHERNCDLGPEWNRDCSRERNRDPSRKHNRGLSREQNRDRETKRDRDQDRGSSFRRSDQFPKRRAPRKGHALYVYGEDLTPTLLRGAFSPFGNIIDLSMDPPRKCAFVAYEKMESADQAVAELNGTQVESVQLKVGIARKQPMLDAATGKSVWGSLALQSSPEDGRRDKRTQIVYSDDGFNENLVDGF